MPSNSFQGPHDTFVRLLEPICIQMATQLGVSPYKGGVRGFGDKWVWHDKGVYKPGDTYMDMPGLIIYYTDYRIGYLLVYWHGILVLHTFIEDLA